MKTLTIVLTILTISFLSPGENLISAQPNTTTLSKSNNLNLTAGTMANDIKINDDTGAENQQWPAIAMNKYGYTVMCWMDARNYNYDIYAQLISATGFTIKSNFKVSDDPGTDNQLYPDVAMNNQGRFIIVWEDYRNNATAVEIRAQLFESNGEPIGVNFRVNEDVSGYWRILPAVAMDGEGNFVVCWQDDRNGVAEDIYAQRYDAAANPMGPNVKVNYLNDYHQISPCIDMNDAGSYIITWGSYLDEQNKFIYAQRFDNHGSRQGGNFEVSNYSASDDVRYSDVAIHNNGNFMICWCSLSFQNGILSNNVFARFYDSNANAITERYVVNDTPCNNNRVSAFASPRGGYGIAWNTVIDENLYIYTRNFNETGVPTSICNRVNDTAGGQIYPDLAGDGRGITVFIWEDYRNENSDIYATAFGPVIPLNLTAGTGFDEMVPLSWDPVYATPEITNYNIYRSIYSGGPYTLLTSIDLTERGLLGSLMRDWIDMDVTNGTTYYYVVTADISGWESSYSVEASATPSAGNYTIQSNWATTSPAIDGEISAGEWDDALAIDIANKYAPFPITLYVKNLDNFLYLAVDNPNDNNIKGNLWGILFDEDHDGVWDISGPSNEGIITINSASVFFTGYWGLYPNNLGADIPAPASGIAKGITVVNEHVHYEAAFDLTSSPLNVSPAETIGIAIWIYDPDNFYPYHYGNAAEWPAGALWEAAASLGDLTLAVEPGIGIEQTTENVPQQYYLSQNYPNPFNPETTIDYHLPQTSEVVLTIHNTLGQEIRRLVTGMKAAGQYSVLWDGRDELGLPAASGMYFYRVEMKAGKQVFVDTRKMVLMK